jgi:hypothetical protein
MGNMLFKKVHYSVYYQFAARMGIEILHYRSAGGMLQNIEYHRAQGSLTDVI